jgi:hypothetical protein
LERLPVVARFEFADCDRAWALVLAGARGVSAQAGSVEHLVSAVQRPKGLASNHPPALTENAYPIASSLDVSDNTVRNQLIPIFGKPGVRDRRVPATHALRYREL